jgi:Asp-tRNA(Asn)/Glu-tRNA(Gln) amidotransferase A subunit family amidase
LIELSALELRRLIASREVSPVEVLDAFIAQIERADPAINAFTVTRFEDARAEAGAARARLAPGAGEPLDAGALCGLPLAIKDLSLTRGLRTTFGSPIYRDFVPDTDDLVVQFVKEAGAVIVGKTNTTEFGAGNNTTNAVFGATVNPFDAARTSGGSSGGAAAALAANMIPLATGSDTGGSLRVPATFCGVTSLKPTPGLIPFERRTYPYWPFQLQGAMARSVDDLGLLVSVMARDHPIDPMSYPRDPTEFREIEAAEPGRLRVAFSPDLGFAPTSAMIRRVFDARIARFQDHFAVAELDHPDLGTAARVNWVMRGLQYLGSHKAHYAEHRDQLGPNVRLNYEQALQLTVDDVVQAFTEHASLHREMDRFFARYDVLVCPGATVTPFPKEDLYVASIDGEDLDTYVAWAGLTNALSTTGNPVVCVPCGRDEEGLPFGFQIVGPRRGDGTLLRVARSLEQIFAGDPELARPVPAIAAPDSGGDGRIER